MASFAERMMKKMGWSEGKGLGKDETGITSFIKVAKPVRDQGIGVTNNDAGNEGWKGTAGNFSSALAALSSKYGGADGAEQKRKTARAPKHTKKGILASKDTARYSSHDMRAILGAAAGAGDSRVCPPPEVLSRDAAEEDDSEPSAKKDKKKKKRAKKSRASDGDADADAAPVEKKKKKRKTADDADGAETKAAAAKKKKKKRAA